MQTDVYPIPFLLPSHLTNYAKAKYCNSMLWLPIYLTLTQVSTMKHVES